MPPSLPPFIAESTLRELPLHYFQVTPQTLGQRVANQFEKDQWLPGVIIADEHRFWGMLSRRRFNEWLSSPYGIEVLLERPISVFLELSQQSNPILRLADTVTVSEALEQALSRSADEIYEPVVVESQERVVPPRLPLFLLEFQALVRAQTQVTQRAHQELHQHRKDLNRYVQRLGQAQVQLQRCAQQLQAQEVAISSPEPAIADEQIHQNPQQAESLQDLQQLTQRLVETSQVAIGSSQKAFQGTLGGISIIIRNTQDIAEIGQLLTTELDKVQTASHSVRTISRQVRQLAVQATIAASQADTKLTGFSSITNEIGQMVSRTLEVGREMDLIANRFTQKLQTLSLSAQEGMTAARSLMRKVQRAEVAIQELESVTLQARGEEVEPQVSSLPDSGDSVLYPPEHPQALVQKITHLEGKLANLAKLAHHQNSGHLVRKIQRILSDQTPRSLKP